jgi:hypothetical protein
MDTNTSQTIHTAVIHWARARFHTDEYELLAPPEEENRK